MADCKKLEEDMGMPDAVLYVCLENSKSRGSKQRILKKRTGIVTHEFQKRIPVEVILKYVM
jgi:hypothetical protein